MRLMNVFLLTASLSLAACHPGPVIDNGSKPPQADGTIAGLVTTSDANVPVTGRKVTAIDTTTGSRYEATTAANGGYSIKVPEGTYRIEVELRSGEILTKQPNLTRVNKSDLDPGQDFVITVKPA